MIKKYNNKKNLWTWYFFDAGNSAHALIISALSFPVFYKTIVLSHSAEATSIWGFLYAGVLLISALLSPWLTSQLYMRRKRAEGLRWITAISIIATLCLGLVNTIDPVIISMLFVVSTVCYFLALPIYNSFLADISNVDDVEVSSSYGWATGYAGGIVVIVIALVLGLIKSGEEATPESYRYLFLLAAVFYAFFTAFLLFKSKGIENSSKGISAQTNLNIEGFQIIKFIKNNKYVSKILLGYWMVNEAATVAVLFTSIALITLAGVSVLTVFKMVLFIQVVGVFSTWGAGIFNKRLGFKIAIIISCVLWILVPVALFSLSKGAPPWVVVTFIGMAIGTHHTIVRANITKLSISFDQDFNKGLLFGYLETSGRVAQVLGPILVGVLSLFSLEYALLSVVIFPILGLIIFSTLKEER